LSEQLEQLQTKNNELEVTNGILRGQLDELQNKCGDLITLVEQTSVVRDDLQSFTDLLEIQIKEISGEKAKSVKLKDLHTELLSSFMVKSQQVCSDLHLQIKTLEVSCSLKTVNFSNLVGCNKGKRQNIKCYTKFSCPKTKNI